LANSIDGPSAWRRGDLSTEDYRVALSGAALDEIRRAADELRQFPLPTILRRPDEFAMPACRAAMEVRRVLDAGVRFAIVDRLPLDAIGAEAATAIYWLLSSMVARPVAQSLDGKLVYDVRDTGRAALPGSGVRPDQTNIELKFHTDNSYNRVPPDTVVLLCLKTAQHGGHSRVASFHTLYNAMLARVIRSACRGSTARSGSTASANSMRARRRYSPRQSSPRTRNCGPASAPTRSAAAMP